MGILVLLFAGLSLAGNFFFSKDGTFGGNSNSKAVKSSPSSSRSTTTAQRSNKAGGTPVQANSDQPPVGGAVTGEVASTDQDPIEVIDTSNAKENEQPVDKSSSPESADISGVDTVIIIPDETSPVMGRVRIDVTPWAVVYFDGDSIGTTPLPPVSVSPGSYVIKLSNPEFPSFETLVDVLPDRETPVEISLWTLVGSLQVEVYPYAKVYINDILIDETPLDGPITVEPGSHLLTLEHPTLGVFESTFRISAGESKTLRFNLNELR